MAKSIPNDIFQYSLHSAYNAGLKDGGPPVAFLTNHGNHGLGVFEDEESDLVQVDGIAYSIDKDGDVEPAEKDDQLPFVMVTIFQPTQRVKPPQSTTNKKLLEVFQAGKNTTMPFRIRGPFKYINTKQQTYWDAKGTIFGFFVPNWQSAISGEGLQCCFLSEDKGNGGRVVEFETDEGAVLEWSKCGRFHLGFPQDEDYDELQL
ncbi:alpha-acetolactate decarboxylase [Dissoconium aciculare CBS 342.82]|jgi:alpha-acetolactate decarboxylase|uniref:Alpha-acetolactate decarboxylase n=1 Tax=Dissoconium aciculare CBS 342.82 TaxID=1314786 RepID=A0A6J3MF29_9PEZI|nr:alpha-acetolactate decarboxylase [Dissoconium aciculare CBS 342.82]KAF1825472.1 alpha-acetolactate decarboxylase [Dissoconium aciculare CBS 342.82]